MATLDDLNTKVRALLSERVERFWLDAEIDEWNVDGIREVHALACLDVLHSMITGDVQIFAGTSGAWPGGVNDAYKIARLIVEESDGEYGLPWAEVSPQVFSAVVRREGNADQDSTATRIYTKGQPTVVGSTSAPALITLYPIPAAGRSGQLDLIPYPATTGTLDLPEVLLPVVIDRTLSYAWMKKSRDLPLADRYALRWRQQIADINAVWFNRFGLSAPITSNVRSVG